MSDTIERLAACDEGEHHEITRLRSEVERLTRERDALAVEVSTLPYPSDLAEVTSDRDRLAAALAEVREAAGSVFPAAPLDHGRIIPPERARLFRALAATPAALAAAHDARVRAEGASAMRAEAARRLRNIYTRARKATVGAEAAAIVEAITPDEAIRAEAERIGGGR